MAQGRHAKVKADEIRGGDIAVSYIDKSDSADISREEGEASATADMVAKKYVERTRYAPWYIAIIRWVKAQVLILVEEERGRIMLRREGLRSNESHIVANDEWSHGDRVEVRDS